MTAETLQPGPLSPGMVSLLTAGRSVLRVRDGEHGTAFEPGELLPVVSTCPGHVRFDRVKHGSRPYPSFRFDYIGELADPAEPKGWITAPPGGWKSNPVGDARVQLRYDFGSTSTEKGSVASQIVEGWWKRTEAFRLVDEATGESGSSAAPIPTEKADSEVVVWRPIADRPREAGLFLIRGEHEGTEWGNVAWFSDDGDHDWEGLSPPTEIAPFPFGRKQGAAPNIAAARAKEAGE